MTGVAAGQAGGSSIFPGAAQPQVAQITAAERAMAFPFPPRASLPRRQVIFVTPSVARRRDFTSAV